MAAQVMEQLRNQTEVGRSPKSSHSRKPLPPFCKRVTRRSVAARVPSGSRSITASLAFAGAAEETQLPWRAPETKNKATSLPAVLPSPSSAFHQSNGAGAG